MSLAKLFDKLEQASQDPAGTLTTLWLEATGHPELHAEVRLDPKGLYYARVPKGVLLRFRVEVGLEQNGCYCGRISTADENCLFLTEHVAKLVVVQKLEEALLKFPWTQEILYPSKTALERILSEEEPYGLG